MTHLAQHIRYALFGAACAFFSHSATATNLPTGGGLLHGGLQGTYFSDANFSNEAFTRRDIRIDFDWGNLRKPGGSLPWTKLGQLGADNYSVRWEGQLMSRFSETYNIKAFADSARIWIKPAGSSAWPTTPVIDYWPGSDPASYAEQTASFVFTAGQPYDIRIEYRERNGTAMMRLLWSSPSTPEEVIQPTSIVGEIPPTRGVILADAVLAATNWGENYPSSSTDPKRNGVLDVDADGWPVENFSFIFRPTDTSLHSGTYLMKFLGSARVSIGVGGGTFFSADGSVSFGTQTQAAHGYDAGTNTTTLRFVIANNGRDAFWPTFTDTNRDGPGGAAGLNSGVTDIRIFRPSGIGSTTPHGEDELFTREAIATLETFVTFRWNDVNGTADAHPSGTSIGAWEHRRPWRPNTTNTSFTAENHEYKILLSNHSGRDLYIQLPHLSDDDYILNLARLIRFGGNANGMPYTSEQTNPYFPPLNPNLRVNVEYSNESPWNTAGQYPQGGWMQSRPGVLREAWLANPDSPDGRRFAILNFDNAYSTNPATNINGMASGSRFFAMRTVEISEIFRSVFGDDAMPAPGKQDPRVRPVLMYQYDNNNGTATNALNFIDRYYNKTSPLSTFPGDPKPVSHFIYGGGAATYYASADRLGIEKDHPLTADALGSFETPVLAPGAAVVAPSGSPWSFSGTAGIYREATRTPGTFGNIPAPDKTVDAFNQRGMKITVGPQDVAIYEVGRYVHPGNAGNVTMGIYEADPPHVSQYSYTFSMNNFPAGSTAWQRTGREIFLISRKNYSYPIILQAGKSYYIVAQESATGNTHSGETEFVPPAGVTVDGSALGSLVNGVWTWQTGATPNRTYGPINFKLATLPHQTNTGVTLGFLNDSKDGMESITSMPERYFSPQAAFLAGTGSMEIDVTFPAPGVYGLVYSLAHKRDQTPYDGVANTGENPLDVFLIENGVSQRITPSAQDDIRPRTSGWSHEGYWAKPNSGYDFFGSAPFTITDTSRTYRIRFAGTNASTDRIALLDNIHIASGARMTEGQIPSGGGFAEGAPDVSNWEARVMSMYKYPQAFGLKAISYEGGWYPGGDANKMPLQYASSFFAPAMVQGEKNAINALARAGLAMNTDYTLDFAMPEHGVANPDAYNRIVAWRELNAGLPAEPTNGQPLTSIFTSASAWLSDSVSGSTMNDGGWFAWNVIAPESGYYALRLETTGSGTVTALVDDALAAVSGTAGGVLENTTGVFITKGIHTIRVLTRGGSASLVSLSIGRPGQLPGFTGVTASPGNAEAYIRWNAVAGADGYHVYYKSRLDSGFTRYTTTPITDLQIAIGGLLNESTYQVVVTYVNSSGVESAYSNQASVVPSENPPLLAWEFDDEIKTSGAITTRLQSANLVPGTTITAGPYRALTTNSSARIDAVPFSVWDINLPNLVDTHYLAFSVTPVAGKIMRLAELQFGLWQSGTAGNLRAELRVSTDGFATHTTVPLAPDAATVPTGNMGATTGRLVKANLTGIPALLNLPAGTTAEFRIYLWGEGISYWGIGKLGATTDDVVLYGFPVDPGAAETPAASLPTGTYTAPLEITLATPTNGAQIRYTTDGSQPSETHGTLIPSNSGVAVINSTCTLRAVAFGGGKTASGVLSRSYTIAPRVAAPVFSPAPDFYTGPVNVTFFTPTSRASIRYTTDGSLPTASHGILYTGPVRIDSPGTLRAIAFRSDLVPSEVISGDYTFDLTAPGSLAFSTATASIAETAGSVTLVVRRTGGYNGAASVNFATASGTATAGADFTHTSGTLNWGHQDNADKFITLPILNDELSEGAHTFTVHLSNASGAALGTPSSVTVTITDDDVIISPDIEISAVDGAVAGEPVDLSATLDGSGAITSAWSVVSGPGSVSFADASQPATTAVFSAAGNYVLRISASDDLGSNSADLAVSVASANTPPQLANPIPDQIALVGEAYNYAFPANTFTDAQSSTLSYAASLADGGPLPAWLALNEQTRTFSGTPGNDDRTTIQIRVIAADSGGLTAEALFAITVSSEIITLHWGGGAGNIMNGTALPTTTASLTGVWNASNRNWGTAATNPGYGSWVNGAVANLGYFTDGANAAITTGFNPIVSGLYANLEPTTGNNRLIVIDSDTPRTLVPAGASPRFLVQSADATRGVSLGGNVSLGSSTGTLVKDGRGLLQLNGANNAYAGALQLRNGVFAVRSAASLAGVSEVELRTYRQNIGGTSTDSGALANPNLTLNFPNSASDKLSDNATLTATRGVLTLRDGGTNARETIGRIVLNTALTLETGSTTNGTVLTLGHPTQGLSRGFSGLGTLIMGTASSADQFNAAVRIANPGNVPTGVLLPWISTSRAGFVMLDAADQNTLKPIAVTNADLNASNWNASYGNGTTNLRVNGVLTGSINTMTLNSLGFLGAGSASKLDINENQTLTIGAGAIAMQGSGNVEYTISGGNLTTPQNQFYIATGSAATSTLVLDTKLTGNFDIIKSGIQSLKLGGSSSNVYQGALHINQGNLQASKAGAITGDVFIRSGASLQISHNSALNSTANITVDPQGQVNFNSSPTLSGTLSLTGSHVNQANHAVVLNKPGTGFLFNGGIWSQSSSVLGSVSLQTNLSYAATATEQAVFRHFSTGGFQLRLDGAEREFSIEDSNTLNTGLAEMRIESPIVNGSGSGSLRKTGGGTLQLTAANTYNGTTTVATGALRLSNISAPARSGITATSASNSAVVTFLEPIAQSFTPGQAISGTFISSGRVITAILNDYEVLTTGTNSAGISTNIAVGALSSNASLAGGVTVNPGAVLTGNGAISGAVQIAGTLCPGDPHGSLTLGSTLQFQSGSRLEIILGSAPTKIAFASAGNHLAGSGNATLALTLSDGFDFNESYIIFENVTTEGFTFSAITGHNPATHTAEVQKVGNNYVLTFSQVVAPTYQVTYEANGANSGSVPVDANVYLSGAVATVAGNSGNLAKTGFTFSGWNTNANGSGVSYSPGATFAMPAASVILHAQWTPLPPYDAWADGIAWNGANSSTADPDGDGIANLLEYALGGNPLAVDTGILPVAEIQGTQLSLSFTPARLAGVRYQIEVSADLVTWSSVTDVTHLLTEGVRFCHNHPADSTQLDRSFIRLRVRLEN